MTDKKSPSGEEGAQTSSLSGDSSIAEYREQVAELLWEKLFDLKHMPLPEDQILTQAEIVDDIMDILHQSNIEVLDRLVESLPNTQLAKNVVIPQQYSPDEHTAYVRGASFGRLLYIQEITAIIERQKQQLKEEGGDGG